MKNETNVTANIDDVLEILNKSTHHLFVSLPPEKREIHHNITNHTFQPGFQPIENLRLVQLAGYACDLALAKDKKLKHSDIVKKLYKASVASENNYLKDKRCAHYINAWLDSLAWTIRDMSCTTSVDSTRWGVEPGMTKDKLMIELGRLFGMWLPF